MSPVWRSFKVPAGHHDRHDRAGHAEFRRETAQMRREGALLGMGKDDKLSFVDHRAKLSWARQHLDALEAKLSAYILDGGAYTATVQYNAEEAGYIARIRVREALPLGFALMVGDIIHNMRSALDSLAYGLSVNHSGVPTEQEARNIQFLICDEPGEFNDPKRARYVSRMSPLAQTAMERLQPCNTKPPGFKHPLSVLRDLSNIDKHRHVILARAIAQQSSVTLSGLDFPPGTEVAGVAGPFEDGTIIARWKYPTPPTAKVDVRAKLAVVIEFGTGPAAGGGVVEFLGAAHTHIRNKVFTALEGHLT